MFSFAWISYGCGTWLDDIDIEPWLPVALIVGGFAARSFDHWPVTALWSGIALIAAQATVELLGVPIHHGLSNIPHGISTHLQLIFLETLTDLTIAAGIALGAINVTKVTYDSQGDIRSIHVEGIFNIRFFLLFAVLPFFITGVRSLEAGVISAFLHAHVDTWNIIQSDILGYFIMMPVVFGAIFSLIRTPTLKPDIKPLWAYMMGFTILVIVACAAVATETIILTPVQMILMHGLIGITALILPSLHVVGRLLLLNCLGILYSSQFIEIEPSEILLAIITFSLGTLVIMLSRMIGQLKQNRSNDRMDAYLKNGVNAYVIKDPDYQNVFVSEQFTKMTGYDVNTFSGATDFYVNYEDHKRLVRRPPVGDEVLGDRIDLGICKIRCKNGSEKNVHRYSRLFTGPDGKQLLLIAFDDVTEVEQARQRSEVYLHAGTSLFFIRDADFELEFISEPLIKLLGYTSFEEIPPTKEWRYEPMKVSTAREFMNSKPLGEAFVLPEVTHIRTKDGRKLSFVETFKWFEDPITDRRMLMTSYENVTDLIAEKDKIETLRKRSEKMLEAGVNAFIVEDDKDNVLYASPAAMALLKFTSMSQFVVSEDFYVDLDPEDLSKFRAALARAPEEKIMKWGARKIRCGDGSIVTVDVSYSWFQDVDENWMLMIGFTDVTELVAEQEFTNNLLSSSSALIITQTRDGVIHSVSQAFLDLMGYAREDIIGRNLIDFYHPEDKAKAIETRRKFFDSSAKEITFERRLIDANDQIKTVMCNLRKSKLDSKHHTVLTLSDVTAAKEAEEKLKRLVEMDELTGLFSRRGLNRRFGFDQRYEDLGMYLIDLDHFKAVNDGYGHHAGDELLKATANALKSQTRTEGSCFRLGGEEFAVLRPWRGWKDAHDFAENLRELIGATSIDSDGRSVQRTASIGVSFLPVSGSMSEALKLGDMVLREAKALGRNRSIPADETMLETLRSRGMFIQASEVQLALERGELEYFVQPIVNGPDTNTVGFEALVRWFLPSGELVEPKKFVDLLYQVIRQPRYAQLKLELRRQVLEQLKDYPEQYISFNFTLEQIGYLGGARALHREIQSILDHPDRQIVIELSEKALHARVNEKVLIEELSQLRAYGYKIALDDFGVEASNIQRLQHYPIDIVKLDRSLIMDIETSEKARKMVGSIAVLLKSLELDVIVEGIETKEQAEILNQLGLTIHQGYLYSKPVPPAELKIQAAE